MKLCVRNGYVLSPGNKLEGIYDIYIEKGKITEIREAGAIIPDTEYIDASDKLVVPGLIDLHVHFRDPGYTYKEDIISGSKAAAKGGFTTVCCMPNTDPVTDNPKTVLYIDQKADGINLLPVASITKGQEGEELVDIEKLIALSTRSHQLTDRGIAAISEDGKTVADTRLMRMAMERAKSFNLPIFSHCEDQKLTGGSIRLGERSKELGIEGIPKETEAIIVARDILLAKETGCKLHLCHISTKESIDLIRMAKDCGLDITAETAPHYFTLTDRDVENGLRKMNPPLGDQEDMLAIREGLKDGTIDAIATDHAPHHESEKMVDIEEAAFGVVGLETSFAVSYTELVKKGILTTMELIDRMSVRPAKILGIDRGVIDVGRAADLTIIDIKDEYRIDSSDFVSKGKNTPFEGMKVFGKVVYTLVEGKVIYHDRSFDR
jgi:dihydroorotase